MYILDEDNRARLHDDLNNKVNYFMSCEPSDSLLFTIRHAFITALHKNNHKLVVYIIDQVKIVMDDGGATTSELDMTSQTVAKYLVLRLDDDYTINLDRKMIDTLMLYPWISHWFAEGLVLAMAKSSLLIHNDVRLFKRLTERFKNFIAQMVYDDSIVGLFKHNMSSDDIIELVTWHQETGWETNNVGLLIFGHAMEYKRFDVALRMLTEMDARTVPRVTEYHKALAMYANTELLSVINYNLPDTGRVDNILNHTSCEGNIDFLKHVHQQLHDKVAGLTEHCHPVLDNELIMNIKHHDHALYVLDNLSQLLQQQSIALRDPLLSKWLVQGIDANSDSTRQLVDTLLANTDLVNCQFYLSLYSSAVDLQRVDMIELVKCIMSHDNSIHFSKNNIDGLLCSAISRGFVEGIVLIIGAYPSNHVFTVEHDHFLQADLATQQTLLTLIKPGQLLFTKSLRKHYTCQQWMTIDILRLIHRHGHGKPLDMLLNAAMLGALDILKDVFTMNAANCVSLKIIGFVCQGSGDVDVIRYLMEKGIPIFDIGVALGHAFTSGNLHTVDYLLSLPDHIARGGEPGYLIRDDVFEVMENREGIDPTLFTFMLDHLELQVRQDQSFIIDLLSMAGFQFHMYHAVLEMLAKDQHQQQQHHQVAPFISAPPLNRAKLYTKKPNDIDQYQMINSVVQLFRPPPHGDVGVVANPFIIPCTDDYYQTYQKMIIDAGRFPIDGCK
ncbi:hypothetical protein SAMD00019534_077840 [Acytostelium subglobosum LB1]|uniref:hypothetical protein n=1 Tax=Acytostelium subglobosum LB1 TaxID=1410327 RepID=UPI0006451A11|nr:hypothetical protein SAMD00019534_077840 [Acytostelium subglobosum LB1]GAM24609.1 hypothetical protein SAMD00019534_077840 [Acytostelium subglobosum LB1]|eukprot:XP_012752278.1 hypothetical protein SAMD00019534_077840 [Acytostelium subglobosum LB1]